MYLCTDHLVICGQLENCTLTFVCPLVGECVAKEKNGFFQPEIPVNVGFV